MKDTYIWNGSGWTVEVLFSRAGVSTAILVTVNSNSHLLLDCGDGTLRDLLKSGVNLKEIAAVLVSHGHFDHVGGLHPVLGFMRMIGRTSDLLIAAPKESLEDRLIIDSFVKAYVDTIPEVVHHGSTEADGITAPLPSLGYKLNYGNETVVYTGDCGLDSRFEEYVGGADLAIIEATLDEPGGELEARVHLSVESAKRLAETARAAFIVHRTKGKPPIKLPV
jgi:ribonuclease BN (tRNA processing enzyme)